MGGRGASSNGGGKGGKGGGGGGNVTKAPQQMTDSELSSAIKETNGEISSVKDKMSLLSEKVTEARFGRPKAELDKAMDDYYGAQSVYRDLQVRLSGLEEEQTKRKKKTPKASRTFVNSYGEAATRSITNTNYRNSQKRLERQVERVLGI